MVRVWVSVSKVHVALAPHEPEFCAVAEFIANTIMAMKTKNFINRLPPLSLYIYIGLFLGIDNVFFIVY